MLDASGIANLLPPPGTATPTPNQTDSTTSPPVTTTSSPSLRDDLVQIGDRVVFDQTQQLNYNAATDPPGLPSYGSTLAPTTTPPTVKPTVDLGDEESTPSKWGGFLFYIAIGAFILFSILVLLYVATSGNKNAGGNGDVMADGFYT
jgi:hypothetical protein